MKIYIQSSTKKKSPPCYVSVSYEFHPYPSLQKLYSYNTIAAKK